MLFTIEEPRFYITASFITGFWLTLLALEVAIPRFWCRFLCSCGPLLSLYGKISLFKRHKVKTCKECGSCSRHYPAAILSRDGSSILSNEFVLCETCVRVFPFIP